MEKELKRSLCRKQASEVCMIVSAPLSGVVICFYAYTDYEFDYPFMHVIGTCNSNANGGG